MMASTTPSTMPSTMEMTVSCSVLTSPSRILTDVKYCPTTAQPKFGFVSSELISMATTTPSTT